MSDFSAFDASINFNDLKILKARTSGTRYPYLQVWVGLHRSVQVFNIGHPILRREQGYRARYCFICGEIMWGFMEIAHHRDTCVLCENLLNKFKSMDLNYLVAQLLHERDRRTRRVLIFLSEFKRCIGSWPIKN